MTKWAEKEYPISQRILALIPAGFLFAFVIPYFLVKVTPRIDEWLGIPGFGPGLVQLLMGLLLILIGAIYALWSISAQIFRARGTPLPMMATQTLIVTAPFDQCRNPMSFGTILLYLGVSLIAGSITAIGLIMVLSALLVLYIKRIEEKELEARFGDAYLVYKARTPFLIPRIRRKA
jgi:protein-S-isoprenylcysteine O-methyltransferase Ste14